MFDSTFGTRAPSSSLGLTIVMYQTTLFFIETFTIPNIKLVIMFHLAITLCEGGGTPRMVDRF
jgi:hypothetical protein